ncbi:MAG: branched-chain-amino-acid transaminase [Egibacteraceae bacterium]
MMGEQGTRAAPAQPFGSVMASTMALAWSADGAFDAFELGPVAPLPLHPAAHALHYGSACFEGLKAHRGVDGTLRLFRLADHAERMRRSAATLSLPVPDPAWLAEVVREVVAANAAEAPPPPGALYVRPTLLGVDANIGAATHPATEALLFVLCSPVGDYLASGRALSLGVETTLPRTTPQFGAVKAAANYAMALAPTLRAREVDGVDQVLFAPGGLVQEAGPANFLLIDGGTLVTPPLDGSFLHGITRDSVLRLAATLGYTVEERPLSTEELTRRAPGCEAALVGTAAVLGGVGRLVVGGEAITVGDGEIGPRTTELREALVALQQGAAEDAFGWTEPVG